MSLQLLEDIECSYIDSKGGLSSVQDSNESVPIEHCFVLEL